MAELDNLTEAPSNYEVTQNIAITKGVDKFIDTKGKEQNAKLQAKLKSGQITNSVINKLHLIKLSNGLPFNDKDLRSRPEFKPITFTDLCKMDMGMGAQQYDVDDFLYCKNLGFPINHLITLRRFPYPCTDNLWDKNVQGEPDIARMVTYFNQDINKLDELLSFSYKMKWKELTSEMEQATMQGDQSGYSGFMKKAMTIFDPELAKNSLRGENANTYDPKHDQNKVYGPVDSITNTHIRDVGLDFDKEFEVTFEYELRSINGRTPEYAMKDIMGNILATTYNNGKFWPGSRFWIGERPSKFYKSYQYMDTDDMDKQLFGASGSLKSMIAGFSKKGNAVNTLKQAVTNGFQVAFGKILDKVGRPGILTMNSLLSGEPTGFWHLTIGNPVNPILCVGNLICTDVDWSFPTDSLSYGDFPTKLLVKVKLKPGQSKDRAGIEMMFNAGKQRIYYAPKNVEVTKSKDIAKTTRSFFNFDKKSIDNALGQTYDFVADGVKSVTKTTSNVNIPNDTIGSTTQPTSKNNTTLIENATQ